MIQSPDRRKFPQSLGPKKSFSATKPGFRLDSYHEVLNRICIELDSHSLIFPVGTLLELSESQLLSSSICLILGQLQLYEYIQLSIVGNSKLLIITTMIVMMINKKNGIVWKHMNYFNNQKRYTIRTIHYQPYCLKHHNQPSPKSWLSQLVYTIPKRSVSTPVIVNYSHCN